MLKQRIITALILIPLVIAAIWYLPNEAVAVLVGLLMLGCAWEWALFVPLGGGGRVAFVVAAGIGMAVLHPALLGSALTPFGTALVVLWWLLATIWLPVYPRGFRQDGRHPVLCALIGWLSVLGCYLALWNLHALEQGRWLLFLLLAVVWATDTGGYFAGKRFGRRKLAAQISPNKTWEGLWGGVGLAAILAWAAGLLLFDAALIFGLLGLGVALLSVVGDLTVSMFKRQSGVKDTGNLFPGHGGALDRLDSLLSAAPALLVGIWLLGGAG